MITTIEFIGGVVVGLILGTIATSLGFIWLIMKKSGVLLMTLAGIKAKHAKPEEKEQPPNSS